MERVLYAVVGSAMMLVITACSGGEDDDRGSLGKACTSSSDCGGGLTCETGDPLDGLCTQECSSSAECVSDHGFGSFCIGANYCVRECYEDSHCLSGTVCDTDNRWCR